MTNPVISTSNPLLKMEIEHASVNFTEEEEVIQIEIRALIFRKFPK